MKVFIKSCHTRLSTIIILLVAQRWRYNEVIVSLLILICLRICHTKDEIAKALSELFPYIDGLHQLKETQTVYSLFVGNDKDNCVKLDICYDENPIFPLINSNGIRMVSEKDIAAMKINAITQDRQRKKDFWDIHDLLETYSIEEMISFALKRYPWSLDLPKIIDGFKRLPELNDYTEIRCLKGKYWEFIVEDLMEQIPILEEMK